MRNLMKFSLLIGMIAVLFLSACKKDEPEPSPEPTPTDNFGVFKQYLIDNNMDIPNVLDGWITTAAAIQPDLDNYYVIDIRSASDFANGHIPGAVNSTLGDVLTAAGNSGGKPIIVACYTGQTAGHAVLALRLSGYSDAKVLKWGMCSWNPATAVSWPANIGSSAVGNSSWTFPAAPAGNIEFGDPNLETTAEDGAGILEERVAALLAGGMNAISKTDVLASPSDYFVNNYWTEEENDHYGHIADAYRISPLTLAGGEYQYLNQSATIVSYCYTGQTSSMLTAYLKVLGYNAKSLLFGENGMIYENMESHQWADTEIQNFELETSLEPYDGFPTLKDYLVNNNMDVTNLLDGWITTAEAVYTNIEDGDDTNDFYIIDIRGADDYAAGHIEGAVNATYGGILEAAEGAAGHTIVVACYTGQTAGHAVTALRLSGYPDAKVLMWGMCSWNASTAVSWPSNVNNTAVGHTNWTPAPGSIIANNDFGDPSFQTTQADGANILAERVQVLLSGFNGVANTEVLDNNGDYFINNFWAASDVEHYGHIAGAFRVNPLTLAGGEYKYLNPGSPVVTYCWTGQTSSMLTAYLKVIGYDSKSLLFGANGMIYDNLESHKWSEAAIMGYPLATK